MTLVDAIADGPHSPLKRIAALERIAAALRKGAAITATDATYLVESIDRYLVDREISLSTAFELDAFGRRDPRYWLDLRRRDMALQRAFRLTEGASVSDRIETLERAISRYAASAAWKGDRLSSSNPHHDRLKAAIWDALHAWPSAPSASTIRRAADGCG